MKTLTCCIGLILFCLSCKDNTGNNAVVTQTKIAFKKEATLSIYNPTGALKTTLDIEIADTPYERETGLMYRDSMAKQHGMLFIFKNESQRFFYMKNTKIPLDIIYIGTNKSIVSVKNNAKPYDETSLPSEQPAQYVLELNAGLYQSLGLQIGDTVDWK